MINLYTNFYDKFMINNFYEKLLKVIKERERKQWYIHSSSSPTHRQNSK